MTDSKTDLSVPDKGTDVPEKGTVMSDPKVELSVDRVELSVDAEYLCAGVLGRGQLTGEQAIKICDAIRTLAADRDCLKETADICERAARSFGNDADRLERDRDRLKRQVEIAVEALGQIDCDMERLYTSQKWEACRAIAHRALAQIERIEKEGKDE